MLVDLSLILIFLFITYQYIGTLKIRPALCAVNVIPLSLIPGNAPVATEMVVEGFEVIFTHPANHFVHQVILQDVL